MEKYDYRAEVKNDIEWYIKDNDVDSRAFESRDAMYDYLYETLFVDDSVTGNASGSYFMSRWKAEEAICHNFDLIQDMWEEFGYGNEKLSDMIWEAEVIDVSIRCYLLGECINAVLDDIEGDAFYDESHPWNN